MVTIGEELVTAGTLFTLRISSGGDATSTAGFNRVGEMGDVVCHRKLDEDICQGLKVCGPHKGVARAGPSPEFIVPIDAAVVANGVGVVVVGIAGQRCGEIVRL